jgi:hypothetical protein
MVEVLAPFSNGCKEPIYGTPCENGEAGGANDGCCNHDNIRAHMNAVVESDANVLVVYVWCEGRIMQDILREMNVHKRCSAKPQAARQKPYAYSL